jgi:hypothetical protein
MALCKIKDLCGFVDDNNSQSYNGIDCTQEDSGKRKIEEKVQGVSSFGLLRGLDGLSFFTVFVNLIGSYCVPVLLRRFLTLLTERPGSVRSRIGKFSGFPSLKAPRVQVGLKD